MDSPGAGDPAPYSTSVSPKKISEGRDSYETVSYGTHANLDESGALATDSRLRRKRRRRSASDRNPILRDGLHAVPLRPLRAGRSGRLGRDRAGRGPRRLSL